MEEVRLRGHLNLAVMVLQAFSNDRFVSIRAVQDEYCCFWAMGSMVTVAARVLETVKFDTKNSFWKKLVTKLLEKNL
jgi:hypothetical protein